MHLKVSSAKWRPFCLGLNELTLMGDVNKSMANFQMMAYEKALHPKLFLRIQNMPLTDNVLYIYMYMYMHGLIMYN